MHDDPRQKTCPACGRTFAWRKKWAKNWADVKTCSERCRRQAKAAERRGGLGAEDPYEAAILRLLDVRGLSKTICPSEAARQVAPEHWREHMRQTRDAARRLTREGSIEITQGGRVVDPDDATGPIRLRRANASVR